MIYGHNLENIFPEAVEKTYTYEWLTMDGTWDQSHVERKISDLGIEISRPATDSHRYFLVNDGHAVGIRRIKK